MAGLGRATKMTRGSYTVLAALLLTDGEWTDRAELAVGLFPWPIWRQNLSRHIRDIERFTGAQVQRHQWRGYRLLTLPNDEHLEGMLACVPAVRRSAWWSRQDSRIRTAA